MDTKLVMFKPDGQRKDIPLTTDVTIIGRGEDCDLRIPLLAVSRRHCELSIDDDELMVKDLGSANGTFVNGSRVNAAVLDAGDRLIIGPVIFTIQIDGDPQQIAPVMAPSQAAGEEIVDLEEDDNDDGADAITRLEATEADEEELDPIAALEALAAKKDDEDEKKK